jgi:hypothetical protein
MISVALNRPRATRLIAGGSDALIALSDTPGVTAVPEMPPNSAERLTGKQPRPLLG